MQAQHQFVLEAYMRSNIVHPKTMINIAAGLVGIVFDRFGGSTLVVELNDDLTEINGIGPTFARRLNEAGITSFGQLAELAPEQARAITHAAVWQADPADWIAEARQRMGSPVPLAA